jgi:hypothetical protein
VRTGIGAPLLNLEVGDVLDARVALRMSRPETDGIAPPAEGSWRIEIVPPVKRMGITRVKSANHKLASQGDWRRAYTGT